MDDSGNIVAAYRYDEFGVLVAESGRLDQPYRFSTKRYYGNIGLNLYGYRFYAPAIGRWMTTDPIGVAGGLNLYGFVGGNPISMVDIWGLEEGSHNNITVRHKIATTAKGYDGSHLWDYDVKKDNFGKNVWKCNKFVYDVTNEAGGEALIDNRRAPMASEWADEGTDIPNWRMLETGEAPMAGDVPSYNLPGGGTEYTGHTGIMIEGSNGTVSNISAHRKGVYTDETQFTPGTCKYRRYTGE